MTGRNILIDVNGMQFSAVHWGNPNGLPVLALHGWLDNAASFFRVAPHLPDVNLIAVDMAGHGQSSHRAGTSSYHCYDDIRDIFSIADVLGWKKFALLGHSRGAIIGTLAAGTFPDRITHLALIEGLLMEAITAEKSPHQLAAAIKALDKVPQKNLTTYPDVKSAVEAREKGMFPLSHEAAGALTERGLKSQADGYSWSTDPRLLTPTPIKLVPEQFHAFVSNITAPCELIMGTHGLQKSYDDYMLEVSKYPFIRAHMLEGGHHLHMEEAAPQVVELLRSFLR